MNDSIQPREQPLAQACAIPLRRESGRTEVCLITSIRRGRWGFPKGIIELGDTAVETARKEALEEAGLEGMIVGEPLGDYVYAKWGTTLTVTVYLMAVQQTAADWDEADLRQRLWTTPDEAYQLLYLAEHQKLLTKALQRWDSLEADLA